ncbi:GIY-YIG nuclease family protein [Lewinella sp. JB7]|uniref:GIY-YIG nuclease family protein n=1 Tax=Lewinella sp. JB7 TaxID=2962887 RepID=UPI0020C9E35E|nr:GIY-YIG nuclease family protein [Lewinella sp. JB7]MCP9237183.1 GIY-YIG nuclease family protein [Lewinella sp. JB7]
MLNVNARLLEACDEKGTCYLRKPLGAVKPFIMNPQLRQHDGIGAVIRALNSRPLQECPDEVPGIYLLFDQDALVYIGMTMAGPSRVSEHAGKKQFTHFKYLPLPGMEATNLCAIESILISLYSPVYNSSLNLDKKYVRFANAIKNLEGSLLQNK